MEDAIGKRDDEISSAPGIEELVAFKRRVLESGEPAEGMFEFRFPNEIRAYEVFATPERDPSGKVVGVSTVAIDVSGLAQLVRFQREFVAMVAHDLRAPLTVLRARR